MKAGNNSMKDFFVKEPKFSILIALIAIVLLITLFLTVDFNSFISFTHFSELEMKLPKFSLPAHLKWSAF